MNAAVEPAARQGALAGRVVLVVGAHGGLGTAAAKACARAGASVVLLGRKLPKLNRLLDAITAEGGDATAYPLDLAGATVDDYAEMARRIETEFGRLDGVLHCAAEFRGLTPLRNTEPEAFARTLHVDLTARWWLTQACLPLLARARAAAVVFALDDPARTGRAYWGAYGLAQHATAALVAMLGEELAATPVRVCGLQPGPMRTPLRAQAFIAEDDTLAREPARYADDCVALLASGEAAARGTVRIAVA